MLLLHGYVFNSLEDTVKLAILEPSYSQVVLRMTKLNLFNAANILGRDIVGSKFRVSQYMSIYVFKCLPILDQSINVKIAILNLNDPKINNSLLQFVQVIYCVQKVFRTKRFQKRE